MKLPWEKYGPAKKFKHSLWEYVGYDASWWLFSPSIGEVEDARIKFPFGIPNDQLWVKEAWRVDAYGMYGDSVGMREQSE